MYDAPSKTPRNGLWENITEGEFSARTRHSAQMRTAPLEAVTVDKNVAGYAFAFLRLVIPIRPTMPVPNSHAAAGTGIGGWDTVKVA